MVFYVFLLCYVGVTWAAREQSTARVHDDHLYCTVRYRRLCRGKGRHIACQFPNPGPGEDCRNYTQVKFTSEQRHFITNYINRRRQKLAAGHEKVRGGAPLPRPQVMMLVEWDRELALLAQRLADQCNFVHDDCRATVRYPYAGQTVGEVRLRRTGDSTSLGDRRAIRRVLDAWWGERRRVDPKQLTQPFRITAKGSVWGHFSQLAVWSLRAVGCGAARHGDKQQSLLLVCDFSHTNMLGQRTITSGNLAPCPKAMRRRPHSAYPLLCASVHGQLEQPDEGAEEFEDQYDDAPSAEHTTRRFIKDTDVEERTIRKEPIEVTSTTTPTAVEEYFEDPSEITTLILDFKPNPVYDKLAVRLRPKNVEVKIDGDIEIPAKSRGKVGKRKNMDAPEQTESAEARNENTNRARFQNRTPRTRTPTRKDVRSWNPKIFSKMKNPLVFHTKQDDEAPQTETVHWASDSTAYVANSELHKGRHKWQWKQLRDRPERPGAAALLHVKPTERLTETTISRFTTSAVFEMDEEDVKQLFRDTGFHSSWRKSKS